MDRIGLARERLRDARMERESGKIYTPCIQCRYYELACAHPSVATISADPISGKIETKAESAKIARSDAGLCGPEGVLFDRRSPVGVAVAYVLGTQAGWWGIGVVTVLAYALTH